MSNEKASLNELDNVAARNAAETDATLPGARRPMTVVSFEIDKDDDPGGDPYNHTGSFCLPEFTGD